MPPTTLRTSTKRVAVSARTRRKPSSGITAPSSELRAQLLEPGLSWRNIPITLRTPFFRFAFQLHQGKPIARTPRSYRSVTLTPDFWPSSGIVSINDFVGFVFGSLMPPHFLPLPVIPEVSRSSTGSLRNPSPVSERWHPVSAMTVSVPVQWGRSAAMLAVQFSFLHAVPVPCLLSLAPAEVLFRTRRPHPESETSVCLLAGSCRYSDAGRPDRPPSICTPRKWPADAANFVPTCPETKSK